MLVKFLTHVASQCGCFNPEDEAEINDSHAREYISLGYAEMVEQLQTATIPQPQNAMKQQNNRRR